MVDKKNLPYLYTKRDVFYFSRHVPKDLRNYYQCNSRVYPVALAWYIILMKCFKNENTHGGKLNSGRWSYKEIFRYISLYGLKLDDLDLNLIDPILFFNIFNIKSFCGTKNK